VRFLDAGDPGTLLTPSTPPQVPDGLPQRIIRPGAPLQRPVRVCSTGFRRRTSPATPLHAASGQSPPR
jgi:hypothetical protein